MSSCGAECLAFLQRHRCQSWASFVSLSWWCGQRGEEYKSKSVVVAKLGTATVTPEELLESFRRDDA
jgi:hypothetical protein